MPVRRQQPRPHSKLRRCASNEDNLASDNFPITSMMSDSLPELSKEVPDPSFNTSGLTGDVFFNISRIFSRPSFDTRKVFAKIFYLVFDMLNLVANILHPVFDMLNLVANISHITMDIFYLPLDSPHSIVDTHHLLIDVVCHLQLLHRCHPCFFLCQFVQSLQAILDVFVSRQFLQVPF